jgi:hypothetical protein
VLVAVGASAVLCTAAQASTLAANVDPGDSGTATQPQAHTTTVQLDNIDQGPGGNAKSAPVTLTESFPADFGVTLDGYASCPSSKVVHNDNAPDCPETSVVGTASGSAYVPALLFRTTSDKGFIYKLDDHTVRAWIHFQSPQQVGVVVTGVVSSGAAPFGPVITWDFKAIGSGAEAGVEVRTNSIGFVWTQHPATATGPTPAETAAAAKKARAKCNKRARKIKDKRKRKRAMRRCAKAKAKPQPAGSAQTQPFSALSSKGCANGSWPFRAEMSFVDGSSEAADATVACTQAAPPPGGSPPGGPPSPLCPPVCSLAPSSLASGPPIPIRK